MKQVSSLKNIYRRSLFDDSFIGFLVNPSFIVRSSIYRILRSKAGLLKGLNVLDVGCGSKPYKELFKDAKSYVGIDTNNSGHDHTDESIDLFYDGRKMPIESGTYDAAVSFQVIEHVENVDVFLTEISRVVKDNGVVLMSIPFVWPEHEQPYDFRRLTSFGVEETFKKHGFKVTEVIKTTNYPQTIIQMANAYLALTLKTKFTTFNLILILMFNPILNLLGLISSFSRNFDLFCDIVIIAEKN